MSGLKIGEKVIIKDRPEWPSPPGYILANALGEITDIQSEEGFVTLRLVNTVNPDFIEGTTIVLRIENIDKSL